MPTLSAEIVSEIRIASATHLITVPLIAAIVWTETRGRTFASRFEPLYRYVHDVTAWASKSGVSIATEGNQQATSWGLMQLMGGRARELGFTGLFPELCQPSAGLSWACLHLNSVAKRFNIAGSPLDFDESLAAAYDAGSPRRGADGQWENLDYVRSVKSAWQDFSTDGL